MVEKNLEYSFSNWILFHFYHHMFHIVQEDFEYPISFLAILDRPTTIIRV